MQLFKELEQYLEDALSLLTEQERQEYDLFCDAVNPRTLNEERTIGKKTTDLPSAKNYRTGLIEELHARTKRVSDNAVQERWQALLDEPKFQERTLTKTVDSQETTVAELMAELAGQPIDKYACIAIKGNSGLGKTTLVTQMAIALLEPNELNILPLIKKARQITDISENGDIGLGADLEKSNDPYLETWLDSSHRKLLIVDGVDENLALNTQLLDRLHKSAQKYKSHVLLTGRNNTLPSGFFETLLLSKFTEDYLDRMIWETSDDPENRLHVNRFIPDKLKQHPLVLFSSAEILSKTSAFENSNLSFSAISELIFNRDVEVSKQKFGGSKDAVTNEMIAHTIGRYIAIKLLGQTNMDLESTPPFVKALEWELIDSNGINESILEAHLLVKALNGSSDELFWKIWDKLYDDDDVFRWESFVRGYLTAKDSNLPHLLDIDFNGDEYELEWAISLAAEEWILGDLETKKTIVRRIGLESDFNGRIEIRQESDLDENFQNVAVFREIMHFHCMTWMHNTEEWAELEHDATWSVLANKYATTVSPIIRTKAVMYTDAIKNYLIGLHGPRYYKKPDLSAIPDSFVITDEESVKKLNTFLWQFRRPTFNNNTKFTPSLVKEIGLFGRGYLVPRGPLLLRGQTGYVRLPGPILKFLEDYLAKTSTSDYQKNTVRLENLFTFIRGINAGMREARFFVNYDESETLRSLFRSKIVGALNEVEQKWLKTIYAILRNHQGNLKQIFDQKSAELSMVKSTNYSPGHGKPWPSHVLDRRKLHYTNLTAIWIRSQEVYRTVHAGKAGHPYIKQTAPHLEGMQFILTDYYTNEVGRGNPFALTIDADGVTSRTVIYQERLYTSIPHYLFRDGRFTPFMHIDKTAGTHKNLDWGFMPWFIHFNQELLDAIYDPDMKKKYQNLDRLNQQLRAYGVVSNTEQAVNMALSLGVQTDNAEYIGICGVYRKPIDGKFYIHLLTGSTANDIYVSERSAPDAWATLNEQHTKMQSLISDSGYDKRLSLYLKFSVKILQITETKHCVISPVNLRVLCQGCMKPFSQPAIEQDKDILSMCKSCLASVRNTNHFVHHVETFFKGVTIDAKIRSININRKRQSQAIAQRRSLENIIQFFFPNNNQANKKWIITENENQPHAEYNHEPYAYDGQDETIVRDVVSSIYPEETIFDISRIISAGNLIEIHTRYPGLIIGKNGRLVEQMKQRLIDLGLDLKSINVVNSGVHCSDCSQKFIRKKKEIIAEQKKFISLNKDLRKFTEELGVKRKQVNRERKELKLKRKAISDQIRDLKKQNTSDVDKNELSLLQSEQENAHSLFVAKVAEHDKIHSEFILCAGTSKELRTIIDILWKYAQSNVVLCKECYIFRHTVGVDSDGSSGDITNIELSDYRDAQQKYNDAQELLASLIEEPN